MVNPYRSFRRRGATMLQPAPEPTLTDRLRQVSAGLAIAEARVARLLLRTGMLAGLDTVANLAARAGVSGPTVLRLVGKLGFQGFPEFQRAIREELEARHSSPITLYDRALPPSDCALVDHCRDTFAGTLADTFARLPAADFEAAVDLLADPGRPVVTDGGRFTRLISDMLFLHLFLLRDRVGRMRDGLLPREDRVIDISRRTVVVLFDVRRYEARTVRLAEQARRRGATIILLTDPWQSPIATLARIVLCAEVRSPSAFDSLVPMAALCECLIAGVAARLGEAGLARMRSLEEFREGFEWTGGRAGRRQAGGGRRDENGKGNGEAEA
jgi:DNA-binding MurR/RpiR family transcriptional regulator